MVNLLWILRFDKNRGGGGGGGGVNDGETKSKIN